MSAPAQVTVSITFQAPSYERVQSPASLHERRLTAVPRTKAEQMAEDFVAYQSASDATRRKLYRYDPGDGERLVALDFEEVVALVASNGSSG